MNSTWEHVLEGVLIGAIGALTIATGRFLSQTQRRIRREHHQLLRWAKVVGHKAKVPFPLPLDRMYDIDEDELHAAEWEEGLT